MGTGQLGRSLRVFRTDYISGAWARQASPHFSRCRDIGTVQYSIVKELTSRIGLLLIAPGCAPDFLPVFVLGERLGGCRGLGVH